MKSLGPRDTGRARVRDGRFVKRASRHHFHDLPSILGSRDGFAVEAQADLIGDTGEAE
jgi:hypothetical protein